MQPQFPANSTDGETSADGTRYLFPGGELRLSSPLHWNDSMFTAAGLVRMESSDASLDGGFVRIRSLLTGLAEEAFLDECGAFTQEMELQPDTDNALEFAVCDGAGREMVRAVAVVRPLSCDCEGAREQQPPTQSRQPNYRAILDPPWPRFALLAQRCLNLAAEVAEKTGRNPDELCEHIRVQGRYAEQAYEERDQALYCECNDNLEKYRGYLMQLLADTLPRPSRPSCPPEAEARSEIERFRSNLSAVWKQVRERQRSDLETRLSKIAAQARGLSHLAKSDPLSVLRETNRLGTEVEKVADLLHNNRA